MPTISRRALAQGAVWAAPTVLATTAIPAYAASRLLYYFAQSQTGSLTYYFQDNWYSSKVHTMTPVAPELAGFSLAYTGSDGRDAMATLSYLHYYVAIPANLDQEGVIDLSASEAGGSWTAPTRVDLPTLPTDNGPISTSGFNVYRMTFTGSLTNKVVEEKSSETWPGTKIALRFASRIRPHSSNSYFYGGYVFSATLDNGYSFEDKTLIQRSKFAA